MALTPRALQALKPNGRTQRVADGQGLYVMVSPTGTKSWVLRVVIKGTNGQRRDIGLGSVDLVPLAEARDEARRLRKIARAGGDPLEERRAQERAKAIPTFEEAAKKVHAAHAPSFRNEKHRKQWIASLNGVVAAFGAKRVDVIESSDILAALSPGWLITPETSRRVFQRTRMIFDWCKAKGYRTGDNPTTGVKEVLAKHKPTGKHHAALPYKDVPAFVQAVRESAAEEPTKLALELTVLCATRTSETLLARWSEVDLASGTWTIPAERIKGRITHRIPLATRSIEIFQRMKVTAGANPFVFPGRKPGKPLSNMTMLKAIRRMGIDAATTHGFRSSFRDWASDCTNYPHAVCEAALAHKEKDKTVAAYARSDMFERRRPLMAEWAGFATTKPTAEAGAEGTA